MRVDSSRTCVLRMLLQRGFCLDENKLNFFKIISLLRHVYEIFCDEEHCLQTIPHKRNQQKTNFSCLMLTSNRLQGFASNSMLAHSSAQQQQQQRSHTIQPHIRRGADVD